MLVTDLKKDKNTKKYEVLENYIVYVYQKTRDNEMFKLNIGNDYFIVVEYLGENITKEVAQGLNSCYSSYGYMIESTIKFSHLITNIARYILNERE